MKKDFLWRVSIQTGPAAEDAVMEFLGETTGQPASSFSDWETGMITTSVYLTSEQEDLVPPRRELRAFLAGLELQGIATHPGKISIRRLAQKNWAEAWKRHFPPLEIGDTLLIKPTWNRRKPRAGQHVILLDPGLSFGTGHHATTRFCLEEIVRTRADWPTAAFLDIGTGSGLLAIAAAKLGYSPVTAFDNDPEAVRVAGENTGMNGVTEKIRLFAADITQRDVEPLGSHQLVCANLIYDLLLAEAQRITAMVTPGGRLVLAGILATQFDRVKDHFARLGWKLVRHKIESEWQSGAFDR